MEFEEWKKAVIEILRKDEWTDGWITSIDWDAWKESYYSEKLSPSEAVKEEYSYMA